MKLFICEFVTGGGLLETELPENLVAEGELMLQGLIRDCLELNRFQVCTTRDNRLPDLDLDVEIIPVSEDAWETWSHILERVDYAIIIAPETDAALHCLTLLVESASCRLLACDSGSVAIASSKSRCLETFLLNNIRVPTPVSLDMNACSVPMPLVLKPDDGAGGDNVALIRDQHELTDWKKMNSSSTSFHAEEFIDGISASLCLFCTHQSVRVLSVNLQLFEFRDGVGVFSGVEVNHYAERIREMQPLAEQIFNSIPGLLGFVGVDLVFTNSEVIVIEVNPRLTTAYAGLHQSLGYNPAKLFLSLINESNISLVTDACLPVIIKLNAH